MYNVTCFPSRKAIKGLLLKHTPDRCRTVWFCEDRRTLDPCFILDTLIDDAKRKGKPLYVCFIDFAKAYDFDDRSALFCKMIGQGVVGPMLRIIQNMYEAIKSIVSVRHDVSNVIELFLGVKQGCVLSPCLFDVHRRLARMDRTAWVPWSRPT